jgi:hypothetical protein
MSLTKEQIKTAALELGPAEREALAEELLLSVTEAEREAVDAAWLAEAKRRDAAYIRGEVGGKRVEDVIARLTGGAKS